MSLNTGEQTFNQTIHLDFEFIVGRSVHRGAMRGTKRSEPQSVKNMKEELSGLVRIIDRELPGDRSFVHNRLEKSEFLPFKVLEQVPHGMILLPPRRNSELAQVDELTEQLETHGNVIFELMRPGVFLPKQGFNIADKGLLFPGHDGVEELVLRSIIVIERWFCHPDIRSDFVHRGFGKAVVGEAFPRRIEYEKLFIS
jgi:hypothetical protein